jgi:peptide chain release factor 3
MRKTPIMAFINKMDREGRDPFDLIGEIEEVLGIHCCPVAWPIGMGNDFRGVYHRLAHQLLLYERGAERSRPVPLKRGALDSPAVRSELGAELTDKLLEDIALLDGAGQEFSQEAYLAGDLAPVFFGSALNNFGVEPLLRAICDIAPPPRLRHTKARMVDPLEEKFSAFIFKIQANMDPNHRDRVAFMRICSGRFERGMKATLVRTGKEQRLGRPTQFMAQDRSLVDEAYAGDIVGIHDPGIFKIGDSLTEGEALEFTGVPVFAPEHFVRVTLKDPLKSKQLTKALNQLSEEGAVQVFRPTLGIEQYLGVVGVLQFDVVQYRVLHEYGVNVIFTPLPYQACRWIHSEDPLALRAFMDAQASAMCLDSHDRPTILLDDNWRLKFLTERYPKITYTQTAEG